MVKFVLHFAFLVAGLAYLARRSSAFYWRALGGVHAGMVVERGVRRAPARSSRAPAANLDNKVLSPLTGGASSINIYGAVDGHERLPAERAHRRPEPPRRSC